MSRKTSKPKRLGVIDVGAYKYVVYLHVGELQAPDGDHVRGYCDNGSQEIHLCGMLPDDMLEETFLHEVFHAIAFSFRLGMSYRAEETMAGPVGLGLSIAMRPWIRGRLRKPWGKKC